MNTENQKTNLENEISDDVKIEKENYTPPSMSRIEQNTNQNVKKDTTIRTLLFVFVPLFVVALVLIIFSTIFALLNINNNKIISGVFIKGINVSNLSREEAKEKIESILNERVNNNIILKHGEFETTILPSQFDAFFDVDSAISQAYKFGRDSNIFGNNYNILSAMSSHVNIDIDLKYTDNTLSTLLSDISTKLPDYVSQPSYYIDGNNLVITSGKDGVEVDVENLKPAILQDIVSDVRSEYLEIPVKQISCLGIDIDGLYKEVHKDPVDAYYSTNPYVVHPHSNGIDFAISLDEAKNMLNEKKDEYTIPLKTTYPKVTTSQIGSEAFPDLLSSFSSNFPTSNKNRATNVRLATSKLNGLVLMPGETFSYNQTVGQRTVSAGYKPATAYRAGEVVQEVGGGICQVSSTLYNAVLLANLEIVERYNHGFNPGYVKAGTDATVSWGGPDFKFKNNREYPIKIVCSADGGVNSFKIFGLKQDPEYEVVIDAQYIQSVPYKTVYKKDPSLAHGQTKVLESGSNGCKTVTYKIVKLNGNVISKTLLSKDTYNPHNRIIATGE